MRPLLETICLREGALQHLAYHQTRIKKSLGTEDIFHLFEAYWEKNKTLWAEGRQGTFKCRIIYTHQTIESITFEPYAPNPPKILKLIEAPQLAYALKYADRTAINALQAQKGEANDILITQNGWITDTSYCNVAFFDGKDWFTPEKPLLEGTARARLIAEGKLKTIQIHQNDLPAFVCLRVFNAMLAFEDAHEVSIADIFK